jgi:hypothetical protein
MSTEDREERLLRYIEARLAEREEGVEGTITSAPGDAGELWPEAKGCYSSSQPLRRWVDSWRTWTRWSHSRRRSIDSRSYACLAKADTDRWDEKASLQPGLP